jgi:fused signal recognition particle receptor
MSSPVSGFREGFAAGLTARRDNRYSAPTKGRFLQEARRASTIPRAQVLRRLTRQLQHSSHTQTTMFGFGKDKKSKAPAVQDEGRPQGLFARLRAGLARTRANLSDALGDLLSGRRQIDDELLEELETLLLSADVGVDATRRIIDDLTARVRRKELSDPAALGGALRAQLAEILHAVDAPPVEAPAGRPLVILMVGINGAGKTTTIGKLARRYKDQGRSVVLAAGDTFRAAAVEQLQTWGERNGVPVIAQATGADAASVIYDALEAATARKADVLIADTAGRLHTKSNLMEELTKISRVMKKIDPSAPHEVLLVVDAGTGQNALNQAVEFHQAVGLTGIALTKLDGTAKGGILFAIADRVGVPIRFVGVGEGIEDLREFDADEFVRALFE